MKKPHHLISTAFALTTLIQPYVSAESAPPSGDFASDQAFLEKHTDAILLTKGDSAVVVVPAYQGRVMTSTFDMKTGPSFGWINRPVIERGLLSDEEKKGKLEEHIYIFGGEERFWLGPEGGQYALFFKPGTKFEFSDWATPPIIDTEPFKLVAQTSASANFHANAELTNFSGTTFSVGIDRSVRLLDAADSTASLGVKPGSEVRMVGYESNNRITNRGNQAWTPETGLLSIWMLGMYNPSPGTTVVIPFNAGDETELGPKVNDSYFGKVPADYLKVGDDVLFFKGDGTRRGKIGINSKRSKGIAGSYDSDGQVITIVTYNVQAAPNGFVNSMWEMQKEPYVGDVVNAYNDGSPEPGAPPLGPFYELETSSPAAALKPGETMSHNQRTYHFHGPDKQLDLLSKSLLGVSLETIEAQYTVKPETGRVENMAPFTPAKDLKGPWAIQVDPALPNVLILGDSISIGYTIHVRSLLAERANVVRPINPAGKRPENCGDTPMGIKGLDEWLGTTRWDVIHFNWGLWDLCYRNPTVKTQGNRDKVNGELSVTPEQYERNLETLVTRLKATGAKLIWASTTVVPEGEIGRILSDDIKYNTIAARVMQRHGIPTDDLHALTKSFAGRFSIGPHDVHFTEEGYQRMAEQVAEEIAAELP